MYLSSHKYKQGFTLIELLIVIAIIALLAAILFPVFGRARENARRSSCQSNLKQILLGATQYTQDYDERFVLTYDTPQLTTWNQKLQPYLKSIQIFQCPSDKYTNVAPNINTEYNGLESGVPQFHNSYVANFDLGGNHITGNKTLSAIQQPSTTVYVFDGGSNYNLDASPLSWTQKEASWSTTYPVGALPTGIQTNHNWGGPMPRHLEMVSVGFVDGHVKSMRSEKFFYAYTPWMDTACGTGTPHINCLP